MLTAQIKSEMVSAMKTRDALRVETLRGAMAAFTNELVAKGRKPTEELSDTEAVAVLKRLAKQRKESAEAFINANRTELAEKESAELKIIEAYLPVSVSREEIERIAKIKKTELGITDTSGIGKLTGAVIKEFAGTADGNDVKEVVQVLLTQTSY